MGKVALSVIIPTYNRAAYIKDAVTSVLNQQSAGIDYEVIVIDDGSTDDTEMQLAPLLDRIIYKKIPNSGCPAVPRNVGLGLAKGELVAFQDSDDTWPPDKLQSQLLAFDDATTILSYGNAEIMTADGEHTGRTVISSKEGKSGYIFQNLVTSNIISTLTVMARAEIIKKVGGFNEGSHLLGVEDYELWLRLSRLGRFQYIDRTLAFYRRHEDNISHSINAAANEHILQAYKSVLRERLTRLEQASLCRGISSILSSRGELFSAVAYRSIAELLALVGRLRVEERHPG